MNGERYSKVKELFGRALTLDQGGRRALFERECPGDDELKSEVEDLLAHAASAATGFLDGRVPQSAALPAGHLAIPGFSGFELIDAGGSGVVYRAQQLSPRRTVAVKVLRMDVLAPGQAARFRREAEILGSLNHACIAQVFGAGVVESEPPLPWIAMEFVRGKTLGEHVLEARPGTRALIELFRTVCEAVQHAHERGIVHRDLKPSNVMVDEAGRPKVLDFGVARTLTGTDLATAERTRTGTVVGTLAYMAPEQARGERELDARADVYALGAMLFELLTGHLPLALDDLDVLEGIRVVCEAEPERLRRSRPDLAPDLEAILLKALEKEPARRYADAGELAGDLSNYLAERPVRARQPTAIDQARKLVRRNRAVTASLAVTFLALLSGLAFALWSLRQVRAQNAVTSDALDFFASRIAELSPELGFGEEQRADIEELLARIQAQLRIDPESRPLRAAAARELEELGLLDQALQDYAGMQAHVAAARAICEELVRSDPGDLDSWTHLSRLYAKSGEAAHGLGDTAGWESWNERALELDERLVREHPGDLELVEDVGWSLGRMVGIARERGDEAEAERLILRRLGEARELVRQEPENWKFLYNLADVESFAAGVYLDRPELETAYEHSKESVRLARRVCVLQPKRRDFLLSLSHYCRGASGIANRNGASEEARRYSEEALTSAIEVALGDPARDRHLELLRSAADVYAAYTQLDGDADRSLEAVRWMRRVAELARRQVPGSVELERLGAVADRIEAAGLELQARSLAESTGSSASR